MTAKEYLNQVHVMDSRIETLEHTIDEIWTQLTHITADPSKEVKCSNCKRYTGYVYSHYLACQNEYCQHCGAKMDEEMSK